MNNDPQIETAEATETEVETTATTELIDEQLLVEDVSIDGMCGVY
ncbi:mycofactocin precursor MftA [Patulibacter minatonensis]|nr:mycofactocin precursor MftA [Patulibacter minatonensis]